MTGLVGKSGKKRQERATVLKTRPFPGYLELTGPGLQYTLEEWWIESFELFTKVPNAPQAKFTLGRSKKKKKHHGVGEGSEVSVNHNHFLFLLWVILALQLTVLLSNFPLFPKELSGSHQTFKTGLAYPSQRDS